MTRFQKIRKLRFVAINAVLTVFSLALIVFLAAAGLIADIVLALTKLRHH